MIYRVKEVLRKLEFGILEFLLGALMIIGLAGYFGTVSADLDWIDHTVSFLLFTYLFYKVNLTSILFGKTSKFANAVIVISYYSLFFKDVISYTKVNAFKFKVISFVDYFYIFFRDYPFVTNFVTFYMGIAGLVLAGIYITERIEFSHPSFLYAIYRKRIKDKTVKFFSILIPLMGFYFFVYNLILEWLEFTLDDPVIVVGILFYAHKIAKHHGKFHPDNFVFKIGDFSTNMYKKLISLFHYKKTLPLAVSALLILHAISDLGVFAYSMIFFKENFYLEFLGSEHIPFLKLLLEDAKNVATAFLAPLFIAYFLNALSLVIFMLIPVIVWVNMFIGRELHFRKSSLFFIYASAVTYLLLPGYIIKPLSERYITGVDIVSVSLLETSSVLDRFFPDKSTLITAVSFTSVLFGLFIYFLSMKKKIRKELYALSIIGGLTFYTVYLYYFFGSLMTYFYRNISLVMPTRHFLIGVVLSIFLLLSIMLYIGGYLMFLYEIVMEYHRRKWSEPIDDKLVTAVRKIKSAEKRMLRNKKSQMISEVVKYALVAFVSVVVLASGYYTVNLVREKGCSTELAEFEIELKEIDKSLRYGTKELQSYDVPCKSDRIYFFDMEKEIKPEYFDDVPLIKDALKSKSSDNVFIVKENRVKRSFSAGNVDLLYPYYACFKPKFDKISFFAEGAGRSVKIAGACEQPECTEIPIDIGEDEARRIIEESVIFGCADCFDDLNLDNLRATKEKVEMFRKFSVCGGITQVEIIIRPKETLNDFRFYEHIPKECIDDLSDYLDQLIKEEKVIVKKDDPLIVWQFDEIKEEETIGYKLKTELSENCRKIIEGFGVEKNVPYTGPPPCSPDTCLSIGKECGDWPDNCGETLNCGSCTSPEICSGSGACIAPIVECNDGIDNDADGETDMSDPGCLSLTDTNEKGTTECDNGLDDDTDGKADILDVGCSGSSDNDESNCGDAICEGIETNALCPADCPSIPACSDSVDNDGDGKIDFPEDSGCSDPSDNTEIGTVQCNDGIDNDGDSYTDHPNDPGCLGPTDNSEKGTIECDNGVDDDADGKADALDGGCTGPIDDDESNCGDGKCEGGETASSCSLDCLAAPACNDGMDNDGDGKADLSDPGCSSPTDTDEKGTAECDNGVDDDGDAKKDTLDTGCSGPADTDESDCGDGICEGAETSSSCSADCGGPPCSLTSASWSKSNAVEGETITLTVQGNSCNGKMVDFIVKEDDLAADDPVTTEPSSVSFSGNTATTTWIAEWVSDGFGGGDPEYYFTATLREDSSVNKKSGLLSVAEAPSQACTDGTLKNTCSTTKPKFCNNKLQLVNKCGQCECPSGKACQADGSCADVPQACSDGTPKNTCSSVNLPKFCDNALQLVDSCSTNGCPCPSGKICQSNVCVNAEASLTLEFSNINYQFRNGEHVYSHTRVFREFNGVGATLTQGRACYQVRGGCDTASVNYRINANGEFRRDFEFITPRPSETFTITYTGTDDNGNLVSVTDSFTHPQS